MTSFKVTYVTDRFLLMVCSRVMGLEAQSTSSSSSLIVTRHIYKLIIKQYQLIRVIQDTDESF